MKTVNFISRGLLAGMFVLSAFHCAQAAEEGSTPDGIAYVSGGVGDTERQSLLAQKSRFSLWVITAAKRSGAFVAGVRIRVVDLKSKQPVLENTMDGPWFFAALPPGRYQIEATYQDAATEPAQVLKTVVNIGLGKTLRQVMLYFSSTDPGKLRE
jgi:hypothetical protein